MATLLFGLVSLGACGQPELIVPDIMSIVAILPSGGSVNISTDVQPAVYFSHPAADAEQVKSSLHLTCLGSPPCTAPTADACGAAAVDAVQSYESANQLGRLAPASQLDSNMCYAFVIDKGVAAEDSAVGSLPVQIRAVFQTE